MIAATQLSNHDSTTCWLHRSSCTLAPLLLALLLATPRHHLGCGRQVCSTCSLLRLSQHTQSRNVNVSKGLVTEALPVGCAPWQLCRPWLAWQHPACPSPWLTPCLRPVTRPWLAAADASWLLPTRYNTHTHTINQSMNGSAANVIHSNLPCTHSNKRHTFARHDIALTARLPAVWVQRVVDRLRCALAWWYTTTTKRKCEPPCSGTFTLRVARVNIPVVRSFSTWAFLALARLLALRRALAACDMTLLL